MVKKNPEKKTRNTMVDLCRFVAAVMIMLCHLDLIGRPTHPTYMFVDFFFILTGYFTLAHFAKKQSPTTPEERGKIALQYTVKKFLPFLPHLLVAVPIAYIARNWQFLTSGDVSGFLNGCKDMLAEILLLPTSFFDEGYRSIGPLWYLSALLVSIPVFSYICQSKYRRPLCFVGILFAYFFYSTQTLISAFDPVSGVLKCLACMFIGMLVYDIAQSFAQLKFRTWAKVALTIIELLCIVYAVCAGYYAYTPVKFQVIVYVIMLTIMLSGQSYTSRIKYKFFTWLGLLSMPLFIWHYAVGRIFYHVIHLPSYSRWSIVIYFAFSFAAAIISQSLVSLAKKHHFSVGKLFLKA